MEVYDRSKVDPNIRCSWKNRGRPAELRCFRKLFADFDSPCRRIANLQRSIESVTLLHKLKNRLRENLQ